MQKLHKTLTNGIKIAGRLERDEDCQNPCEDQDGMGHVRSLNSRHINSITLEVAQELLKDRMCVPLSYFEHGLCLWDVCGGDRFARCPDQQWDGTRFAGVWEPDDCCREEIRSRARVYSYGKIVDAGVLKRGDRYVATIGTETQCFAKWYEAFKFLQSRLPKRARAKREGIAAAARELAAQCCQEYTNWANGDCWGYIVKVSDPDGAELEHDSCWGFIGSEYAEGELADVVDRFAKQYADWAGVPVI